MIRIKAALLIVFISVFFTLPIRTFAAGNTKTIVVFFALHANLPAYQNLLEGFRTTLSEEYQQPTNLLIEYLDIGRIKDDKYARFIIEQSMKNLKTLKLIC